MFKITLSFIVPLCIVSFMSSNLHAQSCCSATEDFAALGVKADFRSAHAKPRVASMPVHAGQEISIRIRGNTSGKAFMYEAEGLPKASIIVIHEWWGLNDNIKNAAHQIFEDLGKEVDVYAVDLYDGLVTDSREEAAKAMQNANADRITDILAALINITRTKKVGTIGWCFGGGWSLQASLLANNKAGACVMYYGMPEKNIDKLKELKAPVLGIFATEDKWITPAIVSEFQQNMNSAEQSLALKMYKADHAFANPSNPGYDNEAANDAWATSLEFFRTHLLK